MEKKTSVVIEVILIFTLIIPLALAVPQLPEAYYGNLMIDGSDAPAGASVAAVFNDGVVGSLVTEQDGSYGGPAGTDPKLLVQGDIAEEGIIEMYINGFKADQTDTFQSGAITNLNLTVTIPTDFLNVPGVSVPGVTTEVNVDGLTLEISSEDAVTYNIEEISELTSGFVSDNYGILAGQNLLAAFEISITGDVDIIATISYDDTGIDESTVKPYKFDGSSWIQVPNADIISIDTSANKITFKISPGGTPYAIFGSVPAPSPTGGVTGGGGGGGGVGGLPSEEPTPPEVPTPPGEVTPTGEVTGEEPTPAGEEAEGGGLLGITGRAIQNLIGGNPVIATLVILFVIVLGVVFYYKIFRRRKKEEGYL